MNKVFNNGWHLRKAINDFLKGVTGEKDANIHRIKDLTQNCKTDKLTAVSIFHLVSKDPNNKLESTIRLLDKKLMEYRPYPFQTQLQDSFSLALYVNRLITLSKYGLPYEETVQILLEHVLTDQLTNMDFLTLLRLLEHQPLSQSKSYYKLVSNILDLLLEHLKAYPPTPSFIFSLSKSLAKSPFHLQLELRQAINEGIDCNLPFFTFPQMTELSHQMRQKSLQQWMQLGNLETSLVRKRVIYQYILNKRYPGLQYRNFLPGKQWRNGSDLQEAVRCVRSFGVKQAYVDIFPAQDTSFTNPAEGYAALQHMGFVNHYLDHVFTYIKNNYSKIDYYSMFKVVRTIRSLFSEGPTVQPNLAYFQGVAKKYNINLISLMAILYELGRYPVLQAKELQSVTEKMLSIVFSACTQSYLKEFDYQSYKQQELHTIYAFVHCSIVETLNQKAPHFDFFPKIDVFLQFQKEKKHVVNQYSKLMAFYRYAKSLLNKDIAIDGIQANILLQEQTTTHSVKQLLQAYLQKDEEQAESIDKTLQNFANKYRLIQNVLFQPNLEVKYAIASKDSPKIEAVFQYVQMFRAKQLYEVSEPTFEQGIRVTCEEKDMSLHGVWKYKLFNAYYKCQYYFCHNEPQLSLRLFQTIKKLAQQ